MDVHVVKGTCHIAIGLVAMFSCVFVIWISFYVRKGAMRDSYEEDADVLLSMLENIQMKHNMIFQNVKTSSRPNYTEAIGRRRVRSASMGWRLNADDARKVFKTYERCIKNRNYNRQVSKNTIKAILALEGQHVRMTCKLCQRPDQDPHKITVDWQRLRTNDAVVQYIQTDQRIHIDEKSRDLTISAVDVLDAGQYFCLHTGNREYEEIYQLDVLFQERRRIVEEKNSKTMLKKYFLTDNNLMTFTLWSEWSNCNQCGKVGNRRKIGLCMVNKIAPDRAVRPQDLPILGLYPDGVPCRSTVLPKEIANIKRIKLRRSETLMGKCFIVCPTTPAYVQITDKTGKVIETIEAGYHSLRNKPTLPPMVIRRVVYEETGKHLVLTCPGKSETKSLIRWQNGTTLLNPQTIRRQTRGRIFTDAINRLHIRSTRMYDTAPYNCWASKRHVATIKVVITKPINRNLKNYITYAGLLITIVSMSCICICVCKNKGKKTSK